MFTGLIEEVGKVVAVRAHDHGTELQIAAPGTGKNERLAIYNGRRRIVAATLHRVRNFQKLLSVRRIHANDAAIRLRDDEFGAPDRHQDR